MKISGWLFLLAALFGTTRALPAQMKGAAPETQQIAYRTDTVGGIKIFYREAGPANAPTIVLLHGFPSSSHMFRDLIPALADRYHVIAPDYPGFGYSDAPPADQFGYTFDHLAEVIDEFLEQRKLTRYSIYIQDYGSPVGFRLATKHPERIQAIIVQNGNAYEEGLSPFWAENLAPYWKDRNEQTEGKIRSFLGIEGTKLGYTAGVRNVEHLNPDAWIFDQSRLDRAGNAEIQLDFFYDYRNNPPLYPSWQKFLRERKPPVLVVWGKNDPFFTSAGAEAYRRDDPKTELHLLDTGHFALEEDGAEIARLMREFLARTVR